MDKVEITKIVVRIGNKQAELTLEQARELRAALNGLLGDVVYIPSAWIPYQPWYPMITTGITTAATYDNPGPYYIVNSGELP